MLRDDSVVITRQLYYRFSGLVPLQDEVAGDLESYASSIADSVEPADKYSSDYSNWLLYYYLESLRQGYSMFPVADDYSSQMTIFDREPQSELARWAIHYLTSALKVPPEFMEDYLIQLGILQTLERCFNGQKTDFGDNTGFNYTNTPLNPLSYNLFPPSRFTVKLLSNAGKELIIPIQSPPFVYGPKNREGARVVLLAPFNGITPSYEDALYFYLLQQVFNECVNLNGEGIFMQNGQASVFNLPKSAIYPFFNPSDVNIARIAILQPNINYHTQFFNFKSRPLRDFWENFYIRFTQVTNAIIQAHLASKDA